MQHGGIYIHIPFCRTIGPYCDFAVVADRGQHEPYLEALLSSLAAEVLPFTVETMYIGGGTPSRLSAAAWEMLEAGLNATFAPPWQEFTLEVNPEDIDEARLHVWAKAGVSRLSVGVQRLDADGLKRLGRARSAAAVAELPKLLARWRALGGSASVDLIYGLAGDRPDAVSAQVRAVIGWPIEHLSAYALTIEPSTPFARAAAKNIAFAGDADLAAACYGAVVATCEAAGWEAYEVSNFCRDGKRALHNSGYWLGRPYLGFGLAASSFLTHEAAPLRFSRLRQWADYLATPAARHACERLNTNQMLAETLMLGLRSFVGVPAHLLDMWQKREPKVVAHFLATNLLEIKETAGKFMCVMPPKRRLLADEIAARWLLAVTDGV